MHGHSGVIMRKNDQLSGIHISSVRIRCYRFSLASNPFSHVQLRSNRRLQTESAAPVVAAGVSERKPLIKVKLTRPHKRNRLQHLKTKDMRLSIHVNIPINRITGKTMKGNSMVTASNVTVTTKVSQEEKASKHLGS